MKKKITVFLTVLLTVSILFISVSAAELTPSAPLTDSLSALAYLSTLCGVSYDVPETASGYDVLSTIYGMIIEDRQNEDAQAIKSAIENLFNSERGYIYSETTENIYTLAYHFRNWFALHPEFYINNYKNIPENPYIESITLNETTIATNVQYTSLITVEDNDVFIEELEQYFNDIDITLYKWYGTVIGTGYTTIIPITFNGATKLTRTGTSSVSWTFDEAPYLPFGLVFRSGGAGTNASVHFVFASQDAIIYDSTGENYISNTTLSTSGSAPQIRKYNPNISYFGLYKTASYDDRNSVQDMCFYIRQITGTTDWYISSVRLGHRYVALNGGGGSDYTYYTVDSGLPVGTTAYQIPYEESDIKCTVSVNLNYQEKINTSEFTSVYLSINPKDGTNINYSLNDILSQSVGYADHFSASERLQETFSIRNPENPGQPDVDTSWLANLFPGLNQTALGKINNAFTTYHGGLEALKTTIGAFPEEATGLYTSSFILFAIAAFAIMVLI